MPILGRSFCSEKNAIPERGSEMKNGKWCDLNSGVAAAGDGPVKPRWSFETVDRDGSRMTTGREAVSSCAMTSASKYEAAEVGAEILKKGGNAVDAAVAMGFALSVTEPFTSGPGGGGMATIRRADGEAVFVDFREKAPAAVSDRLFRKADGTVDRDAFSSGGLACCVPGDVAGLLYMLEHYGTMERQAVLEPAIRIASEGFVVSPYCAGAIADAYELAVRFPEMQKIYWDKNRGKPYQAGDILVNPDLARALQKIAEEGAAGFYTGEIAEAIVGCVGRYGGMISRKDLERCRPEILRPVVGNYRGYPILSAPPPSSGGSTMIEILNILEQFDVGAMEINSAQYVHLFTEAFKLGYADRARYLADPDFVKVPLAELTDKVFAAGRAAKIDLNTAQEYGHGDPFGTEHTDTTHYSVADADGNCVSVTKTINGYFGSGVMVDGWGFVMNNSMEDFSPKPRSVNCVEAGKKPLSSMSPTVVLHRDGTPFMVLGSPGGSRIFATVLQVISRVIDHRMGLHDALCVPRIWNTAASNDLTYEEPLRGYEAYALTGETIRALTAMGHDKMGTVSSGAVQGVMFLEDGKLYGTADPRQDGKAVGV